MTRHLTRTHACGDQVLVVRDVHTREELVLDADPVDQGSVVVLPAVPAAIRYGQPARQQPAWQEHVCIHTKQRHGEPGPCPDPYAEPTPGLQQAGGWRQP